MRITGDDSSLRIKIFPSLVQTNLKLSTRARSLERLNSSLLLRVRCSLMKQDSEIPSILRPAPPEAARRATAAAARKESRASLPVKRTMIAFSERFFASKGDTRWTESTAPGKRLILRKAAMEEIMFGRFSLFLTGTPRNREILHSIHGSFRAGNLIGILGPSGAGKTTLLNILAGHINRGVRGTIRTNGSTREMKLFHKLSCYIMQEDLVQEQLTVMESMTVAANLKLGSKVGDDEKRKIVTNVLNLIGLSETVNTRTEKLSGGQRKRLVIALELINNPPIMFLDEPTTGLDNVVSKQCLELLKHLAQQGRTIICTIHQPSDLLFYMFDQVYFMSDGYCVYNGSVSRLVPFLKSAEAPCPKNSSPADYIVELSNGSDDNTRTLSTASGNGKVNNCDEKGDEKLLVSTKEPVYNATTRRIEDFDEFEFSSPYASQVSIILARMFKQMSRNKVVITVQFFHHVVGALSAGTSFYLIGNEASQAIANFKFFIAMMVFYGYTYIMSPILLFPFEIELIRREYFNRWYSLKAYYTALTISTLPLTIFLSVLFNTVVYWMTGQPFEATRFAYFNVVTILVALNAYGIGITIGSLFKATSGAVVGSALGVCLLLFCMYGMGYEDNIEPFMKFVMFLGFFRQGLVGLCSAMLGGGRPVFDCAEIYCHFKDPEKMLHTMGMKGASVNNAMAVLVVYLILYRVAAYVALKRRVKPDSFFRIKCC